MRRGSIFSLLLFLLVTACSKERSAIEAVKNTMWPEDNITLEEGMNRVAGVSGKVEWRAFNPAEYKNQPDLTVVEVEISRPELSVPIAKLQFLFNTETRVVDPVYFELAGESQTPGFWSLGLGLLAVQTEMAEGLSALNKGPGKRLRPDNGDEEDITTAKEADKEAMSKISPQVREGGEGEVDEEPRLYPKREGIPLRVSPGARRNVLSRISAGTSLVVFDQKGAWFRVETPDGKVGWVSGFDTEFRETDSDE